MTKPTKVVLKELTAQIPEGITEEQVEQAKQPGKDALVKIMVASFIRDARKGEEGA